MAIKCLKCKVLIVDDNEKLCKNLSDILELKGCEVGIAHDGYSAIERIKNSKFDVVLMDVKMPGMNGVDALKILNKTAPDMAIVMITAFADDIFYKEELKNIKFEVIQKPVDIDKLLMIMEKIC